MTIAITWTIDWMNSSTQIINGHSEVVLSAGWRCSGINDSNPPNSATTFGSCSFPQPPTGGSFTPYNQLTQSQVVGWCWANGVSQVDSEAIVTANIQAQQSVTEVQNPLPWNTPAA